MSRYWLFPILAILVLIAAGCNNNEQPTAQPTGVPLPTIAVPTNTPIPEVTYPPTWTLAPSPTVPPAQPTLAITMHRPTDTPVILPSYTPSPIPPTPTLPGPIVDVSFEQLNQAVVTQLIPGSEGMFTLPPTISLYGDTLAASVNVMITPGDPTSARPLVILADLVPDSGQVKLEKLRAFLSDDNATYDNPVVEATLEVVQQKINELIAAGSPNPHYGIAGVTLTNAGLSVQTVTLPE
jgi:hypothetical protein